MQLLMEVGLYGVSMVRVVYTAEMDSKQEHDPVIIHHQHMEDVIAQSKIWETLRRLSTATLAVVVSTIWNEERKQLLHLTSVVTQSHHI